LINGARELGACSVMNKPFDMQDMAAAVQYAHQDCLQ
jgi:hypothetical protein